MIACLEELTTPPLQPSTPQGPTGEGKGTAYAFSTGSLSNLAVELVYEYRKMKRPGLLVKSLSLY